MYNNKITPRLKLFLNNRNKLYAGNLFTLAQLFTYYR